MKSSAKTRVTVTQLASAAGLSENAVRYRVRRGQVAAPDAAGLFDRQRALAELAQKPKQAGGRRRGASPTKLATAARLPRDPAERFRLARARQEELKLKKMQEELVEVAAVQRRVYALFRLVRDRLDGWVSRSAPIVAAATKADEGTTWRAMSSAMKQLESELASLDFEQALAVAHEDGEDEGMEAGEAAADPADGGRTAGTAAVRPPAAAPSHRGSGRLAVRRPPTAPLQED